MGAQNRVWSGALLSLTEWKATPTCQGGLLQSARQHSRAELQKNMDMKHSDQVFHLLSFYPPGGQLLCSVMDSISSPRCSDWCTWHILSTSLCTKTVMVFCECMSMCVTWERSLNQKAPVLGWGWISDPCSLTHSCGMFFVLQPVAARRICQCLNPHHPELTDSIQTMFPQCNPFKHLSGIPDSS